MGRELERQRRLLLVNWEDTRLPAPHWQWVDELQETVAAQFATAGFLLREENGYFVVALTVGGQGGTMQASGVFRIPKRSVISVTDLRETCPVLPRQRSPRRC